MQSELLNKLETKGCRIAETLEATYCGNEALMERIMSRIPETTCLARMETALAAGDAKTLFAAAHELKGLFATAALTPLYAKCCEIVEIARAGGTDGVDRLLPELKTLFAEFCGIIKG